MYKDMTPTNNIHIERLPPVEERNAFYDGLSEREIRRRQDINNDYISRADTEELLDYFRVIEEDLMQAMLRRC